MSHIISTQRLFFRQLRGLPGPRLAAVTSLCKTYYEVFRGGELLQHIIDLHATYCHVVRIAPNELHFNDYAAHSAIYSVGSQFMKDRKFYKPSGADGSAFGAIQPRESRLRRNSLSPLFSRRAVLGFEKVIQAKRSPANMVFAFRCAAMDIITSYRFPTCGNSLIAEDLHDPLIITNRIAIPSIWLMKSLPFLVPVFRFLPRWSTGCMLPPSISAFVNLNRMISAQIDRTLNGADSLEAPSNPTIHHHLLNSPKGTVERSRRDLLEEAFSLLQAWTEGPGNACTIGTFYVLNDPAIHKKLFGELHDAWPNKYTPLGYAALEKLPYLTAVIKDSLRVSHGIVTPLPRIVGPTDALISGHRVPAGIVVGISVVCNNNDESVFREPHLFSPERWMRTPARDLDKFLVPFSKGPRMCIGIKKLEMDIHDTNAEDFKDFKDFFIPVHEGRNLRVRVKDRGM